MAKRRLEWLADVALAVANSFQVAGCGLGHCHRHSLRLDQSPALLLLDGGVVMRLLSVCDDT